MLVLLLILTAQKHRVRDAAAIQILRKKFQKSPADKENSVMFELARKFIGHTVSVYTLNGEGYTGTVTEVTSDALLLDSKRGTDLISLNFVTRIREVKPK